MTYTAQLKATLNIREAIANLIEEDTELRIKYKDLDYIIRCYSYDEDYGASLSIEKADELIYDGMNVRLSSSKKTYLHMYSYDMMSQQTSYKMRYTDMELVEGE